MALHRHWCDFLYKNFNAALRDLVQHLFMINRLLAITSSTRLHQVYICRGEHTDATLIDAYYSYRHDATRSSDGRSMAMCSIICEIIVKAKPTSAPPLISPRPLPWDVVLVLPSPKTVPSRAIHSATRPCGTGRGWGCSSGVVRAGRWGGGGVRYWLDMLIISSKIL